MVAPAKMAFFASEWWNETSSSTASLNVAPRSDVLSNTVPHSVRPSNDISLRSHMLNVVLSSVAPASDESLKAQRANFASVRFASDRFDFERSLLSNRARERFAPTKVVLVRSAAL